MARAMVRGLLAAGHNAAQLQVVEPDAEQQRILQAQAPRISVTTDHKAVAETAAVVVLAVKPQVMANVAAQLAGCKRPPGQILVSVAAGISLKSLQAWFGNHSALVRVMPNTPALVGAGIAGACATTELLAADRSLADYIVSATGKVVWLDDESLMDAVTAVSGSGPAYFFLIMEIMQQIAEDFGLDRTTAHLLCTQTALGAAKLASESTDAVSELRRQVTSPGGTTEAALQVLEQHDIRGIFKQALAAARQRSVELGQLHPAD